MPTAPLYYAPYMRAIYESTKLGDHTVGELRDQQLNYATGTDATGKRQVVPVSAAATKYDAEHPEESAALKASLIDGFSTLQSELPGAVPVRRYQIATSYAGSAANRIMTHIDHHPELVNEMTPDQAREQAQTLVGAVPNDISGSPVKVAGDIVDVDSPVTALLQRQAAGKELLTPDEAAAVAWEFGREVQRTVTPAPLDEETALSWLDRAESVTASHWAGATAHVAKAMGLSTDFDKLEELAAKERARDAEGGPTASLGKLLAAARIDPSKPEDATRAFDALQAVPADQMHVGLMQAVVGEAKLPPDTVSGYADRLLETGGSAGNVQGLLDTIELAKRDAKPPPPANEAPPGETPPPGNAPPPDDAAPPPNAGSGRTGPRMQMPKVPPA